VLGRFWERDVAEVGGAGVRMNGFKLEGGELFKEDFCKLLKQK